MGCPKLTYQPQMRVLRTRKPELSREVKVVQWFTRIDPLAEKLEFLNPKSTNGGVFNPQNLSLYTYTYNSPVLLSDPTGENPIISFFVGMAQGIGKEMARQTASQAAIYYAENKNFNGFRVNLDYVNIAKEGVKEGTLALNPIKTIKNTIKGGSVVFDSLDDARIGLIGNESEGKISIFSLFKDGNEGYLTDFLTSLGKNMLNEFLLDDMIKETSDLLTDGEITKEVTNFLFESFTRVITEIADDVIDKVFGGNTTFVE